MFGLQLEDGTKICGLCYKLNLEDVILIDAQNKWFKVTRIAGRIAYCMRWFDERTI
ncbi:hypothetical protein MKY54_05210 [Paenibacillus sp. FSL P2-0121]|uniref:hypothetical protein n=1 Tax=Paenibacillus sp. FSL P2-0121 TaxID=2921626 RepID=UPI0030CC56A8